VRDCLIARLQTHVRVNFAYSAGHEYCNNELRRRLSQLKNEGTKEGQAFKIKTTKMMHKPGNGKSAHPQTQGSQISALFG
jgi:hypothetical protein